MTATDERPGLTASPAPRFSMPVPASCDPLYGPAELSDQLGTLATEMVRHIFATMAPLDTPFGEGAGVLAYFSEANSFPQFAATLARFIGRYAEQATRECNGPIHPEDPEDDGDCLGAAWCARCAWQEFIWHTTDNAADGAAAAYEKILAGVWEYVGVGSGSDGLGYSVWRHRLTGERVSKRPDFATESPAAPKAGRA